MIAQVHFGDEHPPPPPNGTMEVVPEEEDENDEEVASQTTTDQSVVRIAREQPPRSLLAPASGNLIGNHIDDGDNPPSDRSSYHSCRDDSVEAASDEAILAADQESGRGGESRESGSGRGSPRSSKIVLQRIQPKVQRRTDDHNNNNNNNNNNSRFHDAAKAWLSTSLLPFNISLATSAVKADVAAAKVEEEGVVVSGSSSSSSSASGNRERREDQPTLDNFEPDETWNPDDTSISTAEERAGAQRYFSYPAPEIDSDEATMESGQELLAERSSPRRRRPGTAYRMDPLYIPSTKEVDQRNARRVSQENLDTVSL